MSSEDEYLSTKGKSVNRFENRVKKLLADGKSAWGVALGDASEYVAKASIDTGADFLWIDLEHRPYGVEAIQWVTLLCRMKGCVPMVRVAGLDPQLIKKAFDVGASAVMVPQINNAEEARLAVQYSKYPPEGSRGVSPVWPIFMDVSYDEYLPFANDESCVIVQVESPEGMKNVEEIAAVEGIDVVFAGPLDISASMGHLGEVDHPEVQKFFADFPARVATAGKPSGITFVGYEKCKKAHDMGYRFIAFNNVLSAGKSFLENELSQLRELS